MKHVLVYEDPVSLNTRWIAPIVSQYFDLVPYDSATTYSDDTIFCINVLSRSALLEQGRRVVIDNLWERPRSCPTNCYAMTNNNWFWYNDNIRSKIYCKQNIQNRKWNSKYFSTFFFNIPNMGHFFKFNNIIPFLIYGLGLFKCPLNIFI